MKEKWNSFVSTARSMMAQRQVEIFAKFGVDFSTQYHWDLDRANIVFKRNGISIVRADLQYLGSIVRPQGSWLWGWANETIPSQATNRLDALRRYGADNGFEKLTVPEWMPEGDDGHDVIAVSASVLGSDAFFHDHFNNLALFFVLDHFHRVVEES